ncbi:MAG: purine-nucleoside phosphorylase [Candidatus Delongbacteria bacterium]|nr:purine-nucleoside phosphorylase [Candidatus Delongbacteria bacterium]MCG2760620.1 purine-nucleoside phosphorylase [Candidatus Delongbacteria bacterium]
MEIEPAVKYLQNKLDTKNIDIAIILGSGLSFIEDNMDNLKCIKTVEIPNYPASTVTGHKGTISTGFYNGKKLMILAGRVHYYEGYSYEEVVFPIDLLSEIGVKKLLLTNAAGGINKDYEPCSIVVLENCIAPFSPLFKDQIENPYSSEMNNLISEAGGRKNIKIHKGCYAYMSGPSFETKAEIEYLRILGGDVVGMSTVPETVRAVKNGLEVSAVSRVSNMGTGITGKSLSHIEVLETAKYSQTNFINLLKKFIEII